MKKLTEHEMRSLVIERLRKKGIEFAIEVPLMSRCIDLVVIENEELVSIEFKRDDWRRALNQAKDHLLAVDRSYICVMERPNRRGIEEEVRRRGVGVFFFDENEPTGMKEVLPAATSDKIWAVSREWLKQAFEGRKDSGLVIV